VDIVLTGIARSGTTLACHLLNQLPQCVALHEPMNPTELTILDFPKGYLDGITKFFREQRHSLLSVGRAVSKSRLGEVPDNPFDVKLSSSGLRVSMCTKQEIHFCKQLSDNFRLVIKHPNFFAATLEVLAGTFPCFAIIRNPLAVLLSWHSIQAPVQDGRIPMGEAFDKELGASLMSEPDRLERQIVIMRWYFERFSRVLPRDQVIKYEDVIATKGRALSGIDPAADSLATPLSSRNSNHLYDASLVERLAKRLLEEDAIYDSFYSRQDLEEVRDLLCHGRQ
jgi:hypothetical protein